MSEGALTGVGGVLSVTHSDPVRTELHGHSYEVVAWFPAGRDAVNLQAELHAVLAVYDHRTLEPRLSRGEALGAAIMGQLPGCVGIDVNRPLERIYARVRA
jgi:hypothetical protein